MNVFKCGVVLTGLVPSSFKMFIACCQFICNVSCPKFYLYKILDRVYLHRFLFLNRHMVAVLHFNLFIPIYYFNKHILVNFLVNRAQNFNYFYFYKKF